MPISDIDSHVTTADEFITHWGDVNADRVANTLPELNLPGAYSLALFTADRDALQSAISGLEGHNNAVKIAADDRDEAKASLHEQLGQFRTASDLYLKKTSYQGAVPILPPLTAAESKFLHPFDDVADLWSRVNADTGIPRFTPPLLLRANYDLAAFQAELQGVRDHYRTVRDAENDRDIDRRKRDAMLSPLKERMLEYRTAIDLEYGAGHPFHDTMPSLTPSPGSTPDPVTAQGVWDEATGEAILTWDASTNPNLSSYSIRVTPGSTYDSASATVAGSVLPGTEEFRTTESLTNPGDTASFKVYVILSTGNTVGSNTVVVTRA